LALIIQKSPEMFARMKPRGCRRRCKAPLVTTLAKVCARRIKMFVRLKIEDTREGLVATISQRDDDGKVTGRPSIFLVGRKEEAKKGQREWRELWG
jgi:hypothetical protein